MSLRSEYYDAVYAASNDQDALVSQEVIAAVSFGLSLAVFAAAAVVMMRRSSQGYRHQTMLPFEPVDGKERGRGQ